MHQIYHTDAFVIKSLPQSEAGKFVTLLTKDFGLVRATAQGLRYEKSKLRFAIQDYSKASVSLVRGKNGFWRLTNAVAEKNLYYSLNNKTEIPGQARDDIGGVDEELFKVVARVFRLLERLLPGEEVDSELFEIIDSGVNYLESICLPELVSGSQNNKRDPEINSGRRNFLLDIESIFVLRILNRLGYIGNSKNLNFYISDNNWENSLIEKMNTERKEALSSINDGLRQSQL